MTREAVLYLNRALMIRGVTPSPYVRSVQMAASATGAGVAKRLREALTLTESTASEAARTRLPRVTKGFLPKFSGISFETRFAQRHPHVVR